jgi:uncharacterized membrane protein YfcA
MPDALLYIAVGLLVGILVGLTGVGGGSLTTPILVLVFGQSPIVAVGTDLVFAATTKAAATTAFGYGRRVDWQIAGRLALGSIPAAAAAIVWFWLRSAPPGVDPVISRCLAAMLALTALGLLLRQPLTRFGLRLTSASLARASRYSVSLTVVAGVLIGLAVTVTSVGAGALGTVALLWLYPLRLTTHRLVATDIAHALPVTLVAGLGHAALGHVNLPVLACLLVGSIPGILLASRAALRLSPAIMHVLIAAMLAVAAGRIWLAN